jgi:quinol-cytochrome oxidoreductase complex cytochrome b subunit
MENRSTAAGGLSATWALGSLAVLFFAVEALTGLGLAFHYRPTLDQAYASVLDLREASSLGWASKLHYWGAHALVVVVWLHLVRTFALGRYKSGCRRDWTTGVVLLVLTLALAATGARLPVDAPPAPDQDSLWRSYVLHCVLLPGLAAVLAFVHVRQARRRAPAARDTDAQEPSPQPSPGPPSTPAQGEGMGVRG